MENRDREGETPAAGAVRRPDRNDAEPALPSPRGVPIDPRPRNASDDDAARIEDWVEEGGASSP